jgi:hypothetical protein
VVAHPLTRKNGDAQCANVPAAPSGTFVSSLSSALMVLSRAPSRGILQYGERIDRAHHPAGEEVRL